MDDRRLVSGQCLFRNRDVSQHCVESFSKLVEVPACNRMSKELFVFALLFLKFVEMAKYDIINYEIAVCTGSHTATSTIEATP